MADELGEALEPVRDEVLWYDEVALRDGLEGSESELEMSDCLAKPGLDWRGRMTGWWLSEEEMESEMLAMTVWVRSRAAAAALERIPPAVLVLALRWMEFVEEEEAW